MSKIHSKRCNTCNSEFFKRSGYGMPYWSRQKYCCQDCAGVANSSRWQAIKLPREESFAKWVDRTGECWAWTGALDKDGYGIFSYGGKTARAPRVALEMDGRPVPNGMHACHHCDNPSCVRPDHLYPGTPSQNMADAKKRGRLNHEVHCKLTPDQIVKIRLTVGTNSAVGKAFGVSASNISMIKTRKTWGYVP